ncbi:4-hydroxybenzoate synthetase/chorismate--pyruvate lyase [Actinobacillus equuli]|nr:4-hydroxybenzoate synthetase/chorismate--pyruvate lyase [Actinobacillus equuli]
MTACGLSDSSDYWLREVLLKEGDQAWILRKPCYLNKQ